MGTPPLTGLLAVRRRFPAVEQLAQEPHLAGLVSWQKALELLAELGGLVGCQARGLVGIFRSADELGELGLHGRVALPSGYAGSEIELLPFRMVARLVLQFRKAIEQIIDEPSQPLAA